jgi:hypothetical protein
MEIENKQLVKLSTLMRQFFENDPQLPDDILRYSAKFLFHNRLFPHSSKYPEVYDTLLYLKDIMKRNYLKDINDLIEHFEKKQRGIDEMFDKYKQARAEEQLAMKFQASYETYLKIEVIDKVKKSESLYYPVSEEHYLVDFENISYRNSIEEEKSYLARIKGNQLTKQTNVSFISSERNNQLVSN